MPPKEHVLKGLTDAPKHWESIQARIATLLRREIYLPLLRELGAKDSKLRNSIDDLIEAISSGQIQYHRGHFEGTFTAQISRELSKLGASWDRRNAWWSIPQAKLTPDIRSAIGTSFSKFQAMAEKVNRKLEAVAPEELVGKLSIEKVLDSTIYTVNKDFDENVKGLVVAPKLTPEQGSRLAQEYTQNLQLEIQEFAKAEIAELRGQISKQIASGVRYEDLIQTIQKSYGVSQSKAKFLARQETRLLTTKLQQIRCQDAGMDDYIWDCVHNPKDKSPEQHTKGNVRYYHAKLDGMRCSWSNPPIVNSKGDRKHPGQDYNCRCKARPIVRIA